MISKLNELTVWILLSVCLFSFQAWEAVRLEFLDGGSSSAAYREKLIHYFSQQLRCLRVLTFSS